MAQTQKTRVMVMVVLQARAEGGRDRQPVSDVHGVVVFVGVAPVAESAIVRPEVLNHIDPQREDARPKPDDGRKDHIAHQQPHQPEVQGLDCHGEHWIGDDAKRPGLEDGIAGDIGDGLVREQAEIHRSPEAVRRQLVGISDMVGKRMVKAVPVHPRHGIDVDPEDTVDDGDAFHEPFFVRERAVGDPHMNDRGEV